MLGPLDDFIWLAALALEVCVVGCIIYRKVFRRYFSLGIYMFCAAAASCGLYFSLARYGIHSTEYHQLYYYTGSLITILMYFVIVQFYEQAFSELNVNRYVRGGALILLMSTAAFSYLVVRHNTDRLTSGFVVELGQNLYFVGVVLTYLLWGAILHLKETRTRLIQLVLALGIYFSGNAGTYALRHLFPDLQSAFLQWLPPLFGALLPLAWTYTFLKVPEEARLQMARLVAPQHFAMRAR
jgi:hypothetical protein